MSRERRALRRPDCRETSMCHPSTNIVASSYPCLLYPFLPSQFPTRDGPLGIVIVVVTIYFPDRDSLLYIDSLFCNSLVVCYIGTRFCCWIFFFFQGVVSSMLIPLKHKGLWRKFNLELEFFCLMSCYIMSQWINNYVSMYSHHRRQCDKIIILYLKVSIMISVDACNYV